MMGGCRKSAFAVDLMMALRGCRANDHRFTFGEMRLRLQPFWTDFLQIRVQFVCWRCIWGYTSKTYQKSLVCTCGLLEVQRLTVITFFFYTTWCTFIPAGIARFSQIALSHSGAVRCTEAISLRLWCRFANIQKLIEPGKNKLILYWPLLLRKGKKCALLIYGLHISEPDS